MKTALSEVQGILSTIMLPDNCVTPTILYNEGWLIKLVLRAASSGINCLPFQFEAHSKWFSEVLLHSAFKARFRGDLYAEGLTHADGVIGNYRFDAMTKAGMVLDAACSQLVICEAKIFSRLSQGTSRAKTFDQAARTVGCMAEALHRANQPVETCKSLGLYVFAPASQIDLGIFSEQMRKSGIALKLTERVRMYDDQPERTRLSKWLEEWALPLVEQMDLACYSWESIIRKVEAADPQYGASLHDFYQLCLKYNKGSRDIR